MKSSVSVLLCSLVFLPLQACLQDSISFREGRQMEIRIHVTGGIAGADYRLFLHGETGALIGESCVNLCDFEDGEVLQTLDNRQLGYVRDLFAEARIHAYDGEDFGVLCCDQFHFQLDYHDGLGRARLQGSSEALPADLRVAVSTLLGMAHGILPVIVDFQTGRDSWPGDPFQILEAGVWGHDLHLRIGYGGGCKVHDVKVVAWGGWMESFPVQVRLFVAHEDFDDPCDAWVQRDLTFDLVPLKMAYQQSYGVGVPGKTTLVLLLEDPMLAGPLGSRWLEYVF